MRSLGYVYCNPEHRGRSVGGIRRIQPSAVPPGSVYNRAQMAGTIPDPGSLNPGSLSSTTSSTPVAAGEMGVATPALSVPCAPPLPATPTRAASGIGVWLRDLMISLA